MAVTVDVWQSLAPVECMGPERFFSDGRLHVRISRPLLWRRQVKRPSLSSRAELLITFNSSFLSLNPFQRFHSISARFWTARAKISSFIWIPKFEHVILCRASCRCCSSVHLSLANALFFPIDNSLSKLSPLCRNQTADAVSTAGPVIIHRSAEPITHYTTHTHTHTLRNVLVYTYTAGCCVQCVPYVCISWCCVPDRHAAGLFWIEKNIRRRRRRKRETHTSDNRSPLSDVYMALTLRW